MSRSLYDFIPENARKNLGSNSKVCILSSKDVFDILKPEKVIVMACNTRIRHVIPGIMRAAQELDAVVAYELAKSEGNLKGGYTGMTPETFFETVVGYAEEMNFTTPFFLHGDHVTTKSPDPEVVGDSRELIEAELAAGYTSIAIDASFNENPDNVKISTELGKIVREAGAGLEAEVGEVLGTGVDARITSVEDAVEFIEGMNANGIVPDLLAINNGSKHGNYKPGEDVHIDLQRTQEIYDAVRKWNVAIAQHGITGTPVHLLGRFADHGIRKGNVGTFWQNVAHEGLPPELMQQMREWAEKEKTDIKKATVVFKKEIDSIPEEYRIRIADQAYENAKEFITNFRAEGTASKVINGLTG
ncbi:MAG: class II fructose-bisphosphate aldolase [Deltaproteobacteria bacterium]|nr:class II fructose-bisphosphate aldolase [Deltaproteobacteria bacterium]